MKTCLGPYSESKVLNPFFTNLIILTFIHLTFRIGTESEMVSLICTHSLPSHPLVGTDSGMVYLICSHSLYVIPDQAQIAK